jgi:hypothetical protein
MKLPGTAYAYALILGIFGQTAWGIHAGLMVVNATTTVLLFFLSYRLLGNITAAAVSAAAFAFLSLDRWTMGVFAHATHFVVLFAIAGLLVLLRAINAKRPMMFVVAGVLFGISVLMKQNGIFFLAIGLWIVVWSELQKFPRDRKGTFVHLASLVAGSAIPFVIVCFVLLAQGMLGQMWFWAFKYASEYVSRVSPSQIWTYFVASVSNITRANMLIWILAGVGGTLLWVVRWPRQNRIVLTALTIVSFIAVCPGFYFRPHYFILLLPAISLLCGVAVVSMEQILAVHMSTVVARRAAVGVFVFVVGAYAVQEWKYFFTVSPRELSRSVYGSNPFVEAPEIARYLQAHTSSADRIAVLGSEPEIYFYAGRKSATGYIYTYPLVEQQPYSQPMQDAMIKEITASHPKYIVYTAVATSWLVQNPKERILNWSQAYLNQCYRIVGVSEILPDGTTRWFWDTDVEKYRQRSQDVVYTLAAKGNAPCSITE